MTVYWSELEFLLLINDQDPLDRPVLSPILLLKSRHHECFIAKEKLVSPTPCNTIECAPPCPIVASCLRAEHGPRKSDTGSVRLWKPGRYGQTEPERSEHVLL